MHSAGLLVEGYYADFKNLNEIIGISPDLSKKLLNFENKQNLNFNLLSDPEHKIADAYGVWGLKKFMGREFMGIIRSTFIIDKSGIIRHVMPKVNTKTHHEDALFVDQKKIIYKNQEEDI